MNLGSSTIQKTKLSVLRSVCLLSAIFIFCQSVLAENQLELTGPPIEGGLLQGKTNPLAIIKIDGELVRVSDEGWFLVGFHRDAPEVSILTVEYPDGENIRKVITVEQREYEVQRIDGLPKNLVSPDQESLKRIKKENASIRAARNVDNPRVDFLSGFQWPTIGIISGVYGSQRILNGEPRQPHYGIDIAAPTGTEVLAPSDGVVTLVNSDMFFSGGTLILDHGHGLSSAFLHLDTILVSTGDRVKKGDLIATVGATGRVTGAHLDWRINLFNRRLDPSLLVGPMPN